MQNQLNHVLTQGPKLDESGDWDQQANRTNRGIPLWVRDDKLGSEALSLKEEEIVQKGQAAETQVPTAKRKSTGEEPAPKKKKTASKPQAAKSGTGGESDESDRDEEEEARRRRRRKRRSPKARQRRKRQRNRGPRKPGLELHTSSQLVSPNQEASPHRQRVRHPLLSLWVLRCKLFRTKSNFFACSAYIARSRPPLPWR